MIARFVHSKDGTVNESATAKKLIEELARRRVSDSVRFGICFRDVSFRHENGVLILRGRLPSFYAKQVLQTLLQDLDGVEQIDNQTDVVSSNGLSSASNQRNSRRKSPK